MGLQEAKTPTDLKKQLGVHRESISRALLDLQRKQLVEWITLEQPNFRYYRITSLGSKVIKKR